MKKFKVVILTLCAGIVMAGCSNMAKGTAIGAAGGAVLGAVVGKIAGNTAVGAAVGTAVGAGAGALIGKKMDKVKAQAQAVQNAQVESVTDANGLQAVKVTFDSGILFTTGSATLSQTAKNSLSNFANVLKQNTDCDVAIQGYTDNAGWKNSTAEQSAAKNQQLSEQRAQAVTSYLQSVGVSASQIRSTTGYGEANPVADNSTAAGKAQNRRVEVYMYASQAMIQAAEAGTLK
ncbi:OmpA family protein [Prevotella sp. E9-3]|uniref:OmpA family protein n=1 Tax=Prevotella sp. E9-3 TaxID=2913621 RepID=UPI001EDA1800|nr:OmpA family protein [Prevotella sp. E9-3]UKK47228.1 OmpA family protein [Prevotella sp. E9-3]